MGRRRRRRAAADALLVEDDGSVVEWVPFVDGQPIPVADLNVDVDDSSVEERLDGPSAEPSASTGRSRRDIDKPALGKSNLQKLEDFVADEKVWSIIEPLIEAHRGFVASRAAGCEPEYNIADIIVFEVASWVFGTYLGVHNNLYLDPKNWQRLVDAAAAAFPDNPNRRLSARGPSRWQHGRACKNFLNGGALGAMYDLYQHAAAGAGDEIGMFDPGRSGFDDTRGSFSRPDKGQFMGGDLTWIAARYNRHRSNAYDPRTGRTRRHDPDADYYHNNKGERMKTPGRGLVLLSGRNPYPNERIVYGFCFKPRKGDPAIAGRNDADLCADMFIDLLDKFPGLDERVHGLVYDGAADSEAVDRVLRRGKHAVVPTRRTSKGRHAAANLGAYDFKTATGAVSRHTVYAIAGSAVVVFPGADGDEAYVPLDCKQRKRVARKDGHTLYGVFEMPDLAPVPATLVGAQAIIPFNSTRTEINAKPHKRRTRALRSIAESDPRCARIRGLRPDLESLNSHIKRLLPFGDPVRLRTSQHDRSDLNFLTYCMLQLSAARTAYHERTSQAHGSPPTPLRPSAGPAGPQRLPAGDEPVPKAA